MLSPQRKNIILEQVRQDGGATINDLSQKLKVSTMTIRRDLDELEEKGLLQRTHGGAVSSSAVITDPPFVQRNQVKQSIKSAIGQKASTLVMPGEQIILDSGSTVASMASFLENIPALTVITYSLPVVQALAHQPQLNLICTGGMVETSINALVGPLAEQILEGVRVDKAFLGATSVSLEDGFSNSNLHNLTLQRLLLKVARETWLLADSTKFTRHPFWLVSPVEKLTGIITDRGLPDHKVAQIEGAGLRILLVDEPGEKY